MTRKEHLLVILMEECDEVSQRASKALRFSLEEVQYDQPLNNAERIIYEFNDLLSVMEMLYEEGHLPLLYDKEARIKKREQVEKYLLHSENNGTLIGKAEEPQLRKFKALVNERGLDDFGCSGLTFPVIQLVKGKIYTQADHRGYDEAGRNAKPFFVDDNGCSRDIASMLKANKIIEIL